MDLILRRINSEASNEEPTISSETLLKLQCNISVNTNFMMSGILEVGACCDASDVVSRPADREAQFCFGTLRRVQFVSSSCEALIIRKARLTSAPKYLAVQMVGLWISAAIHRRPSLTDRSDSTGAVTFSAYELPTKLMCAGRRRRLCAKSNSLCNSM